MNRAEALRIGKVIADRWYRHNKPLIQSRQHIERMKRKKESTPVTASVDQM